MSSAARLGNISASKGDPMGISQLRPNTPLASIGELAGLPNWTLLPNYQIC